MRVRFILPLFLALFTLPALATIQTVTLSVPGMTCAACPITVKMALNKIDGVSQVRVSYPDRQAVVTFDDSRASVEALTQATANTGYPSSLKPSATER